MGLCKFLQDFGVFGGLVRNADFDICRVYVVGCLVLVITSLPVALRHGSGLIGFVWAIILIGLGAGCVKATFFPLLGDQYVQRKPRLVMRRNGELAIVDATRTVQLIYNIYYW